MAQEKLKGKQEKHEAIIEYFANFPAALNYSLTALVTS